MSVETVPMQSVMDAATASWLIRSRQETEQRQAADVLSNLEGELEEAHAEISRLVSLNSALTNKVAELELKLTQKGGARGPSAAILERQGRCRPHFMAAASELGGTNAKDLVALGAALKAEGWVLNDIYAVAAQAVAAGQVVENRRGRKAFWYTPEIWAAHQEKLAQAKAVAEVVVIEDAAVPAAPADEEVVIDV